MQIDPVNGTASFASGAITPRMNPTELQVSIANAKFERWFVKGSFETYRFFPEPGIVATADFRDGRMLNVSFSFELPDDSPENWSTQIELLRKQKHDAWLREQLDDPPYRNDWGAVASVFYHQHCGSEIAVSFSSSHAGA